MNASPVITEKLETIVGAANIREAMPQDAVSGVQPKFVVSPENEHQLAAVLAFANDAGLAVIPRGGGTKLAWGNPPARADVVLSTLRLNRVIEHAWADLTVVVEAGCTVQSLQNALALHGQRLALDPLCPERATIGGALSSNDSGALRLRFGALRDLIIGLTVALPDGTLASSGGKVVKNVAGYDLPKLATGAFGTLGIITRAVFRLHPLCRNSLTLSFSLPVIEALQEAVLAIQDSQLAHTALQIRATSDGSSPEGDIFFEATPAGLLAQKVKLQELLRNVDVCETGNEVWQARQRLWEDGRSNAVIAKVSVLPSQIAKMIRQLEKSAGSDLPWQVVLQATGIGWIRVCGPAESLKTALEQLRGALEAQGASLVLQRSAGIDGIDAWGRTGDAIGVMRALKRQLDPKATLNPGRFVGGI